MTGIGTSLKDRFGAINRVVEPVPDGRQAIATTRYSHLDEPELMVHPKTAIDRAGL